MSYSHGHVIQHTLLTFAMAHSKEEIIVLPIQPCRLPQLSVITQDNGQSDCNVNVT